MNPVAVGTLSVLGAVFGLDVVSFPQAMLSRPIVAATLTGALLGMPERGLALGVTLECFALDTLPVGASRYPEWGSSSVVGAALLAVAPESSVGALLLSVVVTLAWSGVGGWSMVKLRQLNAHWARQRHDAVARGSRRTVIGLQLYGLTADLVRGALMTAAGIVLFVPLTTRLLPRWSTSASVTNALLMALAGIVAAGAVHKVFHSVSNTRFWLAAGVALGVLLLGVVT